jgi:hypothetical protein
MNIGFFETRKELCYSCGEEINLGDIPVYIAVIDMNGLHQRKVHFDCYYEDYGEGWKQ